MKKVPGNRFSGAVIVFHERALPEPATPAGYAALIHAYDLKVPVPRVLWATGSHHRRVRANGWHILTPRHAPPPTPEGHLTFALKYEGIDLAVLKAFFRKIGPGPVEALVRARPTGGYARRIWFLYEWLLGLRLGLPDAAEGTYKDAVDTTLQYGVKGERSRRHRVRNNLPGTPEFCPLVFRTEGMARFTEMNLKLRAREAVAAIPRDILARTAAFLLLEDSKSSYAIEGERPPQGRIQRWGRAIGEAGRNALSLAELLRLQAIVIGDARFVKLGLRTEGGFIGEHDRQTRLPLPVHISARPEDLASLIDGMLAFDAGPGRQLDEVIAAAALAFGFVYAHPFEDGNGRLHRYLIHHVLASRGFSPPGIVFPVSAAILESIAGYRLALEDYSKRVMPLIEWDATVDGNVRVRNETADFYRFFDATVATEFLYECVRRTIEEDLPREARFLGRYDRFRTAAQSIADMPERTVDLLFRFLSQNQGRLSARARRAEFAGLTDAETGLIEAAYAREFTPGT